MRIISGTARGTKLFTLDGTNTKPTLDRVKESLFNIIKNDLNDAVVLDLFSGSGALGLEAVSRGAKLAVLCDCNINAIKIIKKNIEKTRLTDKIILIKEDFIKALEQVRNQMLKFDVVFLDPPYETDFVYKALEKILEFNILKEDALVVIETDEVNRIKNEIKMLNINVFDERKYGRVSLIFLRQSTK